VAATKATGGGRAAAKDRAHDYVKAQVLNGADVTSGSVRREHGKVFRLPEGVGGDDGLAATAAVQKLRSRILADDLRALVGDFVALCTEADTTAILITRTIRQRNLMRSSTTSWPNWVPVMRIWSK
jgi:hypothetical protein